MNDILDKKDQQTLDYHKTNPYREKLNKSLKIKANDIDNLNKLNSNKPFNISLQNFVSFEGSYYNENDPLVATSKQLLENKDIKLEDTYLFKYCKNFKPLNYGEVHGLKNNKNKIFELEQTSFFHPWLHGKPTTIFRSGLFGPKDNSSIEHRINRLKNLIINIKDYGYIPTNDDIIEGCLLVKDNDYRFLITSGHHRAAVLYALNYSEKITVMLDKYRFKPNLINRKDYKNWPAVKSDYLSSNDALEFFDSFFI